VEVDAERELRSFVALVAGSQDVAEIGR